MKEQGTQSYLSDENKSAVTKYKMVVVGPETSWGYFIWYEILTFFLSGMPGALGLALRGFLYPTLFRSCGKGVVFGRNMAIRCPTRISIGKGAIFDDKVTLDAKGLEPDGGIYIGDRVFIGNGSIISTTDGVIYLEDDVNISSTCRIGTIGKTRIGKKTLVAAYAYFVGAGHQTDDLDAAISDQPNTSRGGVNVGESCWVGARVTLMDGVTVEDQCIIGAHSLVTRDLPAYSIAVGTPAKVVKNRKDETP